MKTDRSMTADLPLVFVCAMLVAHAGVFLAGAGLALAGDAALLNAEVTAFQMMAPLLAIPVALLKIVGARRTAS